MGKRAMEVFISRRVPIALDEENVCDAHDDMDSNDHDQTLQHVSKQGSHYHDPFTCLK
eukprot:CAMPEP_0183710910 /NCGR_PEP_ID=MMETSP0737-20130205/6535_1 /TAXON_ID=385413 /ORGANISM="Thalassiosira miniscula, Strain CCMP1093" /LENGTH=57 /DNA_ID=CAMNT_0025939285 /DNA_START=89 /DNA_END=262 /DNA_ORIENTATION=+